MKRITVIFTAVILLLCLVPSAGMALLGPSAARANEIAPAEPELFSRDGEFNAELLSDTAEYLDESFYLRQELITLWARVKAPVSYTHLAAHECLCRLDERIVVR